MRDFKTMTKEDVRAAAGQCMMVGFEGTQLSAELKEILKELSPLGVILFGRNIEEPEQVWELTSEIKAWHSKPLLIAIDQEGGRVQRIREGATAWPSARAIGGHEQAEHYAHSIGQAIATELRAMNIDINFAPVLDVNTNPDNPVIGDRAFGERPEMVSHLASTWLRAHQAASVAAVAKHFPGHGDTDVDSHLALPHIEHDLERIEHIDWPPFEAAIAAEVSAIMSAHIKVHALDDEHPATLSAKVLSYLRQRFGFAGPILSDDIDMKGLADHYSPEEIAWRGLNAGIDIFLCCRHVDAMHALYRGLIVGIECGRIEHRQLRAAFQRATRWSERWFQPASPKSALTQVGCEYYQRLASLEN